MAGDRLRRAVEWGLSDPRPLIGVWAATLLLLGAAALWLEIGDGAREDSGLPRAETPKSRSEPAAVPMQEPEPAAEHRPEAAAATATDQHADALPQETPGAPPVASLSGDNPVRIELADAPQPGLVETIDGRDLPRIADDGRQPWQAYRRGFQGVGTRPLVAIVIQEIGQARAPTERAIGRLPPEISLAVSPYARDADAVARAARAAGHELLLMVPMEPQRYPENDPGPLTLLVDAPAAETIDRLHAAMASFAGYIGLVNHMGSRFTAEEEALLPVLEETKRRGLLFLDARATPGSAAGSLAAALAMPALSNDRYIDNVPSAEEIDRQLAELVLLATERGGAIGIGRPLPVTIERILRWTGELEARGVVLAPASALVGIVGPR